MTKVTICIMLLILFISTNSLMAVVKNEDNPAKGTWNFDLQEEWALENVGDYFFVHLGRIRVDDDGNIYLLERKYNIVFILSPEGKLIKSFGKQGEGPDEFRMAQVPYIVGDHLIIQDIGNELKFFTKTGEFKKVFRLSTNVYPRDFIDGNHYLTLRREDPENNPKKRSLEIFDINEKKGTVITVVPSDETVSAQITHDLGTTSITIDEPAVSTSLVTAVYQRKLYMARNNIYLIKKLDLDSNKEELSFSIDGRKGKPVSLAAKKEIVHSVQLSGGRKMHPAMEKKLTEGIPDYCTLFDKIHIDENGLIYVYITDPANKGGQEMDIFSPAGKYLYRAALKLPEGLRKVRPLLLHRDYLYAFVEDEEEEPKFAKYKIKKPII